jgi:tyrosinase
MSNTPSDHLDRSLDSSLSRRRLLETAGQGTLVALTAAFGASAVGHGLSEIAAAATQQTPYTRPNVHSLTPQDLESFKEGVRKMKDLPPSNPSSWVYQANIHGTQMAQPWSPLWQTCEHHTDYFWPWHRMYLYWFEQIVREQSGDPDFALPYWDYSDPTRQYLPFAFRDPQSPLHDPKRTRFANERDETSPLIPPQSFFDYCTALRQPAYGDAVNPGAHSQFESDIHDPIHFVVGGGTPIFDPATGELIEIQNPGTMTLVETSAQDPVFWLHHCNLDRLWASWRAFSPGGLVHSDPVDAGWRNRTYEFFDETGAIISPPWVVSSILDTTALGYVYESLADNAWYDANCAGRGLLPERGATGESGTPVTTNEVGRTEPEGGVPIGSDPVTVGVVASDAEAAATPAPVASDLLVLSLNGISTTNVPAVAIEVYVNLPEGDTPDFRSDAYVGSIGLFTLQTGDQATHQHTNAASQQVFDISLAVAASIERGDWTGEIDVTFVPIGFTDLSDLEVGAGTPVAELASPVAEAAPPEAGPPWLTVDSIVVTSQ